MAQIGRKQARSAEREVNIVLKAKDEAVSILEKTESAFVGLGRQALNTKAQVEQVTQSFDTLGAIGLGSLGAVSSSLRDIIAISETPVGGEFFVALEEAAEQALTTQNKLSDTIGNLSATATPFFEGFLGRTNRVDELIGQIGDRVSDFAVGLLPSTEKFADSIGGIATSFAKIDPKTVDETRRQLEKLFNVGDILGSKGASLGISKIIQNQLGGLGQIPGLSDALSSALLDPNLQQAASDNFVGGIRNLIRDRVTRELSGGVEELRKAVKQNAGAVENAGEILGDQLLRGIELPSEVIRDQLLKSFVTVSENSAFEPILRSFFNTGAVEDALNPLIDSIAGFDDEINNAILDLFGGGSGKGSIKKALKEALSADADLEALVNELATEISVSLGKSLSAGLTRELRLAFVSTFDRIDASIRGTLDNIREIPATLAQTTGSISTAVGAVSGIAEPLEVFNGIKNGALGAFSAIAQVSEQIFFFSAGLATLQQLTQNGPFQLLIGQNVQLREQLIATQSALTATNKIVQNGQVLTDNTQAIQALEGPINSAIGRLRAETLDLVGVTSSELVPIYQQVAGLISNIGGDLDDAVNLSIKFSATLGTLGIPLFQASEEIRSILQGTVDQNTQIAKSLGLTNAQLQSYISQGTIIDKLNEKLEAFTAGNALSARTLNGVTSNIQEVLEEVTRIAGAPLVTPLVDALTEFYDFLKAETPSIILFLNQFIPIFQDIGGAIAGTIQFVAQRLAPLANIIPQYLAGSLKNAVEAFAEAIVFAFNVLNPFLEIFITLAGAANLLNGPLLKLFVTFKVLSTAITLSSKAFGILSNILPVVGEGLFVIEIFTNGVVGQFTNLSKVTDRASGAMILLLKNLDKIPFAAKAVNDQFGPFGRILTTFGPKVGGFAFTLAGLATQSDSLKGALDGLIQTFPRALGVVTKFTSSSKALGGILNPLAPVFREASDKVKLYTDNVSASGGILEVFNERAKAVGESVRIQAASFAVSLGAFTAFAFLFNEIILKNDAFQDAFKALGEVLKVVGNAVTTLFNNPIGQAVLLITGVVILLQTGLIPTLIATAKTMALTFAGNTVNNIASINNLLAQGTAQLNSFAKAAIAAGSIKFPILEVFKSSPDTTFLTRIFNKFEGIGKVVDSVVISVARLGTGGNLKAFLGLVSSVGDALRTKVAGGFALAFGAGRIKSLGELTQGFKVLAIAIEATTVASLKNFATSVATSFGGAVKNIRVFARVLGVATRALRAGNVTRATNAINLFAGANKSAAASTLLLAKGLVFLQTVVAPLLLITVAVTAVVEGFSQISRANKAATQSTDALKSSLSLLKEEFDANGTKTLTVEIDIRNGANANNALDRVRAELENERNIVTKAFDGIRTLLSGNAGGDRDKRNLIGKIFGDTSVDAEIRSRIKDAQGVLDESNKALNDLQFNRLPAAIKVEEELATLQNRLVEARTAGRDKEADSIRKQIRLKEDAQQREKDALDDTIRVLEEQAKKVPDDDLAKLIKDRIFELQELRLKLDNLQNAKIEPPDLPDLGSAFSQLEQRAQRAIDFIEKGVGTVPQFEQQANALLQATETQLGATAISLEEVIARLTALANSTNATAEIQIKAQQLVTRAIKQESDRRIKIFTQEQQTIRNLIVTGQKDEVEGEREITAFKIKELEARRDAAIRIGTEEQVTRSKALQADIARLRDERAKAENDKERADVDRRIESARRNFSQQNARAREKESAEIRQIDSQIAAERIQGEIRAVDVTQKRALELVKKGQNDRLIALTEARNRNEISNREFETRQLAITQETTEEEVQAAQIKLAELNKLFNGKQVPQVREQQLILQDLVLKRLNTERDAQKKQIDNLNREIEKRAIASQNALKTEELAFRRQVQVFNQLERSLDNQNKLLNARKDLLNAQAGLFEAQANALAGLERSEFRRNEIQQGIAAKQLEVTRQNIVLQGQLLEQEFARNRAALEREQIENRIAQAQARSSIAQSEAELAKRRNDPDAAPEELRQLEISVQEQRIALEEQLQLGNFLRQRNQQLSQEENIKRLQTEAEAGTQLVQAQSRFNQTLRAGQQTALRSELEAAIASAPSEAKLLLETGLKTKFTVNGTEVDAKQQRFDINIKDPEFSNVKELIQVSKELRDKELNSGRGGAGGRSRDSLTASILASDDGRLERARQNLSSAQFRRVLNRRRRLTQRQFGVDPFSDGEGFSNLGRKDGRTTRVITRGPNGENVESNLAALNNQSNPVNFQLEEGAVNVNAFGDPEEVSQAVSDGLTRVFERAGSLIKESQS